jgi:serralysin
MSSQSQPDLKMCIDRLPPGQRFSVFAPSQGDSQTRAAALRKKLWQPGRTLRLRFLDGDPTVQKKVVTFAQEWMQYAHITFAFGNDLNAELRISFLQAGSWSLTGNDALDPRVPKQQPTMNFGWLTRATPNDEVRRVVLHEFGHALGLIHEHQNPAMTIPWNKEAVYAYYQGAPNYWTKEQVDVNIFQVYEQSLTKFSRFDSKSIMLYPIPAALTTGGYQVAWNSDLSPTDKQFIAQCYPLPRQSPLRGLG